MVYLGPTAFARRAVRVRAEMAMGARIAILRGDLGTLNPATGVVGGEATSTAIYRGKARIRTVNSGGTMDVGGGVIAVRQVIISYPIGEALARRDDLVKITDDSAADDSLDTRIFRVIGVDAGGLFGDARRMTCEGWYASRYWSGA